MQKGKNERQPKELVWVEKNKQPSHINMLAARICMHVCVYQAYSNNEAKAHTHIHTHGWNQNRATTDKFQGSELSTPLFLLNYKNISSKICNLFTLRKNNNNAVQICKWGSCLCVGNDILLLSKFLYFLRIYFICVALFLIYGNVSFSFSCVVPSLHSLTLSTQTLCIIPYPVRLSAGK